MADWVVGTLGGCWVARAHGGCNSWFMLTFYIPVENLYIMNISDGLHVYTPDRIIIAIHGMGTASIIKKKTFQCHPQLAKPPHRVQLTIARPSCPEQHLLAWWVFLKLEIYKRTSKAELMQLKRMSELRNWVHGLCVGYHASVYNA